MARKYKLHCDSCGDYENNERTRICPRCGGIATCSRDLDASVVKTALFYEPIESIEKPSIPIGPKVQPEPKSNPNSTSRPNQTPDSVTGTDGGLTSPTSGGNGRPPKGDGDKGRTAGAITNNSITSVFKKHDIIGCESVANTLQSEVNKMDTCDMTAGKEAKTLRTKSVVITGGRLSGKSLVSKAVSEVIIKKGIRKNTDTQNVKIDNVYEAITKSGSKGLVTLFEKMKDSVVTFSAPIDVLFIQPDGTIKIDMTLVKAFHSLLEERCNELTFIMEASPLVAAAFTSCELNHNNILRLDMPAYSNNELCDIVKSLFKKKYGSTATEQATKVIKGRICAESFSDAYPAGMFIDELVENAYLTHADRLASRKTSQIRVIEKEDLDRPMANWSEVNAIRNELLTKYGEQTHVIRKCDELIRKVQVSEERVKEGKPPLPTESYNCLFVGPPGSGKSSVASVFAKLYKALGIVSKGHVIEVSKGDIASQWVGAAGSNMKALVDRALDGVLFIDEAYELFGDRTKGEDTRNGKDAFGVLLNYLTKYKNRLVVILGGYPEQTDKILDFNPGMRSRFPNHVEFIDYPVETLMKIFYKELNSKNIDIYPGSEEDIKKLINKRKKSTSFAGARGIKELIDNLNDIAIERSATSQQKYDGISCQDVIALLGDGTEADSLESLLIQLDNMPGLAEVKAKVKKLVDTHKGEMRLRERGIELGEPVLLNLVLMGPPGTCKTTIAKLIAKIYLQLGYLKRDVFIECAARDLIGSVIGASEERTQEYIDKSLGGCLFIDEFYSLCMENTHSTQVNDFNQAVLEKINVAAGTGKLMIIIAGYPDKMKFALKNGNDGLARRFPTRIEFKDYDIDTLVHIFEYQLQMYKLKMSDSLRPVIKKIIIEDKRKTLENGLVYGNGGNIVNLVETVRSNLLCRMARVDVEPSNEIILEDLKEVV